MKIVIDPGHGGTATVGGSSPNNATGPAGTLEKNLTLAVGQLVRDRLVAAGHAVTLTRSTDVNLGLVDRAAVAKKIAAAVFVSIHFNGWSTPTVQGTETFVHTAGSAASVALADCVQAELLKATGLKDRGVKRGSFGVVNPANHAPTTASVLVEISFLTQPAEEARLAQAAYRARIADAIVAGIAAYEARFVPAVKSVAKRNDCGDACDLHVASLPAGKNVAGDRRAAAGVRRRVA